MHPVYIFQCFKLMHQVKIATPKVFNLISFCLVPHFYRNVVKKNIERFLRHIFP